ncbi:MAG TPA: methyltransferase [Candidatus Binatia bacterium]|nr:methyltransferase [Candidatus Binatia bacterium]
MDTRAPDFGLVFDLLTGYQRTATIKAAIELDVFTAIGEGADTVEALAARCAAAPRGVRSLANSLTALGLLEKSGDRYRLGATAAAFLDRRSPTYAGSAVHFIGSPMIAAAFATLTDAVRNGGTAIPDDGTLAPEHPAWVEFARHMAPLAGMTAQALAAVLEADRAPAWNVLDVAAGHGLFGITIAEQNRRTTVTALDWPNVLEVAKEFARARGVADRFRTLPGSAFDVDPGTGYDLVLLTNFLHHFDPPTCETLLGRMHRALAPGGRVAIVEFVPNEDRVSPREAATFSLVMLASTPAGDVYTFGEYEQMLRAAGFSDARLHALDPMPQQFVIATR